MIIPPVRGETGQDKEAPHRGRVSGTDTCAPVHQPRSLARRVTWAISDTRANSAYIIIIIIIICFIMYRWYRVKETTAIDVVYITISLGSFEVVIVVRCSNNNSPIAPVECARVLKIMNELKAKRRIFFSLFLKPVDIGTGRHNFKF